MFHRLGLDAATIVQVHQKATDAKGVLKLKPSDARAAG
ncbi:hypothetical protein P775_02790 [Puniceibacterium antarcticum]|uniref:Uncharacterized protein n=1 Tax=Puniceibacterium antarcticum TaxID=1206336 RepID=A0A2G8RJZ4_9RHOB|nr:hypothetical protein P775_02790 [Puniceibacterium antarcticum]